MELQVELANAANACLLSELWSGRLDGIRNAVLITVSEGIGGAILANGQIITSRSGLAGEFGHSPIDPTGPVCGCGQRGCWEVFASSTAALRYYAELAPENTNRTARSTFTTCSASQKKATHRHRRRHPPGDSSWPRPPSRHRLPLAGGRSHHRRPHHLLGPLRPHHPERDGRHHARWRPTGTRHHQRRRTLPSPWRSRVVLQRHSGYHTSTHLAASGKRSRRNAAASQIDCETLSQV